MSTAGVRIAGQFLTGLLLLAGLCSVGHAVPGTLEPWSITVTEPPVLLPDLQGKLHRPDRQQDKVVLINFWASWCTPCVEELPALERLATTIESSRFEIIAVNIGESNYRVQQFLRQYPQQLTVLLDEQKQLFSAWGANILPTSFLLDRNGALRYRALGAPEWDSDETLSIIRSLLAKEQTR